MLYFSLFDCFDGECHPPCCSCWSFLLLFLLLFFLLILSPLVCVFVGVFYGRFVRKMSKDVQDAVARSSEFGLCKDKHTFNHETTTSNQTKPNHMKPNPTKPNLTKTKPLAQQTASEKVGSIRTVRMFGQERTETVRYR